MSKARFVAVLLALAGSALTASDYDAVFAAIKKNWPQVVTIAVVCDSGSSKASLATLTGSATGMTVLVLDVKGPQDIGKAIGSLSVRKPDALVLLAGDRVAGDGSSAATFLTQRMAALKIPTAATTEAGVKQGASLGIGPGTGGKLMSNAKVAAVAGVDVPAGATTL